MVFFNRNNSDNLGELDDAIYEAVVKSIQFDPSKAGSSLSQPKFSLSSTSSSATTSQANALNAAANTLKSSSFSWDGLVKQFEYEKFSQEDAEHAADHCGADWNAQALAMAKDYLGTDSFSKSGLIDQLEYSGFTKEQAAHGADCAGLSAASLFACGAPLAFSAARAEAFHA